MGYNAFPSRLEVVRLVHQNPTWHRANSSSLNYAQVVVVDHVVSAIHISSRRIKVPAVVRSAALTSTLLLLSTLT